MARGREVLHRRGVRRSGRRRRRRRGRWWAGVWAAPAKVIRAASEAPHSQMSWWYPRFSQNGLVPPHGCLISRHRCFQCRCWLCVALTHPGVLVEFLELSVLPEGSSVLSSYRVGTYLLLVTSAVKDVNSNIELRTRKKKNKPQLLRPRTCVTVGCIQMGYKAVRGQMCWEAVNWCLLARGVSCPNVLPLARADSCSW